MGYLRWKETVNLKMPQSYQEQCLEDYGLVQFGYDFISEMNIIQRKWEDQEKEKGDREREREKLVREAQATARKGRF